MSFTQIDAVFTSQSRPEVWVVQGLEKETDVYLEPEALLLQFSVPFPGIHHDERSLVFKPAFKNHNKHSISWNRKQPPEIAESAFKPLLSWKFKGIYFPPKCHPPKEIMPY